MAAAASGGDTADGPPVPFHDEDSFRAWMTAGNKNSRKENAVPDFNEPDEEELETIKKLRAMLSKRNQDADDLTLSRFIRGYFKLHFFGADDRLERTAIITNCALDWMREIDFDNLPSTCLPRQDEWDKLWPTCVSGISRDKRAVWFSTSMGDIRGFSCEEVAKLHAQQFAEVAHVKRRLMEKYERTFTGMHHMVVIDAGWEDGPGIDRHLLKYLKGCLIHTITGANTTQHYQPDALAKAFVINAPFLYRALFSFARMFMEATSAAKYHLMGSDYMPTLEAAGIGPDAIPMYLGGVAPNPKGLVQRVKIDKGKSETLTCVVGDWQVANALVWSCNISKGACDVSIQANGKTISGGNGESIDIPLTPGQEQKITFTFDNTKGSALAQAEITVYTADRTSARYGGSGRGSSPQIAAAGPGAAAGGGAD